MSEDFFQQGRKEMNALVVYDPREKIVDKDNYILAIHAVSNNTEAIVKTLDFLNVPLHIFFATPSTSVHISKVKEALGKRQFCVFEVASDCDIGAMSSSISDILAQKNAIADGEFFIDPSGICHFLWNSHEVATGKTLIDMSHANRYLWKAIEIATMKYKTAPQVVLDWKNGRCQFCRDYVNWQNVDLPKDVVMTSLSETNSINGNIPNQDEFVNQQNYSLEDRESLQGCESAEGSANATSDGKFDKPTSEVSSVNTTTNKTRNVIIADQEVCHNLWNYRRIITELRDWNYSGNDQQSREKMTFQDVARSFKPPFQAKIQDENEWKRIIFNAKTTPYQIQFYANDNGKKNNCVFTFNFTDWKLPEIRSFLGGRWFEKYVYTLADDIRNRSQSITSIEMNVHEFGYEIDVVVATNKRVYLIECKTGLNFGLEDVKKLKKLADNYTTKKCVEAIGLLVSLHELPKNGPIAKFVKESNRIACACGDNIPQIMRNLLTIQSKSFLS